MTVHYLSSWLPLSGIYVAGGAYLRHVNVIGCACQYDQ